MTTTRTDPRDLALHHALTLAARGWHVFPLRPGTKRPALHGHKSCPRTGPCAGGHQGWEQRATTDPARIRAAWSVAPWNIGIATGPSGLVVVDLDTPKSPDDVPPESWNRRGARTGEEVFRLLCADAGQPFPTDLYTVQTARDGLHLYFRAPEGVRLRNTEGEQGNGLGWKVDTRAWGGYVVGPWSSTEHGQYWTTDDNQPAPLPTWLVQRLTPKPPPARTAPNLRRADRLPGYVTAAVRGERERVAQAVSGAHTQTLYVAGFALGQLVGAGVLPPATAEDELYDAAHHIVAGDCDCTDREVRRTIGNGLRAGAQRPRALPATARGAA
ncbi:bifunctional DNA primase/polymerase [Actinosynnema sp. NPDC059797]